MTKVTVLGGCGAVGSVAVRTLAGQEMFEEVVIADLNLERAQALAAEIGSKSTAAVVNAKNADSIKSVIAGSDVVLNCVGPFYKSVKTVLGAVIDAGINYVDVCDDVDVTLEILEWGERAKAAGVTALIGMGSSPGATNLIAKYAAENLLDTVESIDIFHAHGGEPFEGPGVIGHRFHCMSIDIPMFLEGELKYVKYFEPDGIALRQTFDFPVLGDGIMLYPYPHPEQVTLPDYIKTQQVTNKGTVLPSAYYDLTRDLCQLGLSDRTPLMVNGKEIAPYDFTVAFIIRERDKLLKRLQFGTQRGCCSVVVKGAKDGKYEEYHFHMASQSEALGEGTGIPAAAGTILMAQGRMSHGVFPPEGCINPQDFIDLIYKIMQLGKSESKDGSFNGIMVQHKDQNGKITDMEL